MNDLVKPSIPILGHIKIGSKGTKTTGSGYALPEKWDHFKITHTYRDSKDRLVVDQELMDQLARDGMVDPDGKLRQVPIQVLSDDIDDILQQNILWYHGNKLGAIYNGTELIWHYDTKNKVWLDKPLIEEITRDSFDEKYAPMVDKYGGKLFKTHSVVNCVVTSQNARWGGVYRFRTGGVVSSEELKGSLVTIIGLTYGILRGVPLALCLRPFIVHPIVNGKKITTTAYAVHFQLRGADIVSIQNKAMELAKVSLANQSVRIEYRKLLAAPGEYESDREQADVAAEFGSDPDAIVAAPDPLAESLGLTETTDVPLLTEQEETSDADSFKTLAEDIFGNNDRDQPQES